MNATRHWWDHVSDDFDAWKARQSEDVRDMGILDQIDRYYTDFATDASDPAP